MLTPPGLLRVSRLRRSPRAWTCSGAAAAGASAARSPACPSTRSWRPPSRIADAEGLEAVSMAHVAEQLGFTTMSLYRHVTSKEELLQLMWNASAAGGRGTGLTGDDWRARLRMWAMVQREAIDRHPWITQMPMAAPPMAPNSLTFVERGLEAMDDSGLADADKLRVIGLISSYTLSEARMAHDAARAARQAQAAAAAMSPSPSGPGKGWCARWRTSRPTPGYTAWPGRAAWGRPVRLGRAGRIQLRPGPHPRRRRGPDQDGSAVDPPDQRLMRYWRTASAHTTPAASTGTCISHHPAVSAFQS